jgi:hypothetical protein
VFFGGFLKQTGLLIVGVSMFLSGCVTPPPLGAKAGAENIVLVTENAPNCKQLGEKSYKSPIVLFDPQQYAEDLHTEMKNDALDLGADQVFIKEETTPSIGLLYADVEFYSCKVKP